MRLVCVYCDAFTVKVVVVGIDVLKIVLSETTIKWAGLVIKIRIGSAHCCNFTRFVCGLTAHCLGTRSFASSHQPSSSRFRRDYHSWVPINITESHSTQNICALAALTRSHSPGPHCSQTSRLSSCPNSMINRLASPAKSRQAPTIRPTKAAGPGWSSLARPTCLSRLAALSWVVTSMRLS
jgi:hypothetical protein